MKIFSYGTLWQKEVQIAVFGRTFSVEPDMDFISGWTLTLVKMNGTYYNVAVESDKISMITGAIVKIPERYTKKMDEYEGDDYKRVWVTTMTGNNCQMYVKK